MEPKKFLDLAEQLRDRNDEASHRSAISRAYYAVFNHLAINIEKMNFMLPTTSDAHEELFKIIHNCGVPDLSSKASLFRNLRVQRNNADYLTQNPFVSQMHAQVWYKKAKEIITTFDAQVSSSQGKQALIQGIVKYRKRIKGGSELE